MIHSMWQQVANLQETDPLLIVLGVVAVVLVCNAVAAVHAALSRR